MIDQVTSNTILPCYVRKSIWILVICIVFAHIAGCGQNLTKHELVGIYEITYEPYPGTVLGTEKLTLNRDGTFEQSFKPIHGKARRNSGSWKIDYMDNDECVLLEGEIASLDVWGTHINLARKKQNGHYSVYRGLDGVITLDINDDLDYRYTKIN